MGLYSFLIATQLLRCSIANGFLLVSLRLADKERPNPESHRLRRMNYVEQHHASAEEDPEGEECRYHCDYILFHDF